MEDGQRVAIITGAGTGIGAATAARLSADAWNVVLTGRRRERLDRVAGDTNGLVVVADVTSEADASRVVAATSERFGRIDGVVLSAGIIPGGRVLDVSIEDWRATFDTNVTGPFLLLRAALPELIRRRGAIVAVGSIAAGQAGPGVAAYGPSKAALVRLMQSVAVDFGPLGVRANTVNPGWVRSEMADMEMDELGQRRGVTREHAYGLATRHTPARRPAGAEEVAAAIAWLLSDEASYVNGSVVTVDGGTSIVGVGTLAFGPSAEPSDG